MASFGDVLTADDLRYIHSLPEVQQAKEKLDLSTSGTVYFTIHLTDSLRNRLSERFGLDFSQVSQIPLRWIQGDTAPHIDRGASEFQNTYLVYLNDSPGTFRIGEESYPIAENTGYMFQEGVSHSTFETGTIPRLLLGPMNEFAQPVGGPLTFYYDTEANAIAAGLTGKLAEYGSYTVVAVSGYQNWRLASSSTGPSPQNVVYKAGDVLDGTGSGLYYLYPVAPCFLEGTTILCYDDGNETWVPVENLTVNTLVKTSRDGYKKVVAIGIGRIQNPGDTTRTENRLYKCSPSNYPALKNNLYITGCHSILEFPITEKQRGDILRHLGKLYVTEKKYRLMACLDDRAEPWNSEGEYTIYHFALENEDDGMNYGVYANGGLLVETCAIRTLKNKSNLKLL
jgi:hypothetical protein